jgi:hypothetical protein
LSTATVGIVVEGTRQVSGSYSLGLPRRLVARPQVAPWSSISNIPDIMAERDIAHRLRRAVKGPVILLQIPSLTYSFIYSKNIQKTTLHLLRGSHSAQISRIPTLQLVGIRRSLGQRSAAVKKYSNIYYSTDMTTRSSARSAHG